MCANNVNLKGYFLVAGTGETSAICIFFSFFLIFPKKAFSNMSYAEKVSQKRSSNRARRRGVCLCMALVAQRFRHHDLVPRVTQLMS